MSLNSAICFHCTLKWALLQHQPLHRSQSPTEAPRVAHSADQHAVAAAWRLQSSPGLSYSLLYAKTWDQQ